MSLCSQTGAPAAGGAGLLTGNGRGVSKGREVAGSRGTSE